MPRHLLTLALLAWSGTALSAELRLLDLREFSFEGYELADRRDSYFGYEDDTWRGGTAVNFDLDLARSGDWGLAWDNRVFGNGTTAQYREVGWQYEVGLDLGPKMRVFWNHESRHILDDRRKDAFPLTNMYGVRVTFFKSKE